MMQVKKAQKVVSNKIDEELKYGKSWLDRWAYALTAHTDKPVKKINWKLK